jgi:hypothetical protein
MLWWARQIGACFNYIRIRDGTSFFYSKRTFDFILPIVAAILTTAFHYLVACCPVLFGSSGILSAFSGLFVLLAPFFLAALAAVATFNAQHLDEPLRGHGAFLRIRQADYSVIDKEITRRQFICYLFGYLCMVSLLALVLTLLGNGFTPKIDFSTLPRSVSVVGVFLAYFLLWHVLFVTALAIYFLTDRLHATD